GFATTALADDALQEDGGQAPPPASGERAATLDTLIVTAQKREEALQDVPITLSVLPEQLLQDAGARDIKELQHLVSGMSVTSTESREGASPAPCRKARPRCGCAAPAPWATPPAWSRRWAW